MTDDSTVSVVRADSEHAEQIAPLFDAYRQFNGNDSDTPGARKFLEERLGRGETVIFLAYRGADRDAVGFAQLYPTFSSVSMEKLWILNSLFVAPEARKLGAGRALLEEARSFAVSTGAGGVKLETAANNYAAQSLYESLGWQREGVFTYFLRL